MALKFSTVSDDLRQLIDLLSPMIDNLFAAKGALVPTWFGITKDGNLEFFVTPQAGDPRFPMDTLREAMAKQNIVRCCGVFEAWMLDGSEQQITDADIRHAVSRQLYKNPNRIEVVSFLAENSARASTATRRILRPKRGPAALGPLKHIALPPGSEGEGRMLGLIRPGTRPS